MEFGGWLSSHPPLQIVRTEQILEIIKLRIHIIAMTIMLLAFGQPMPIHAQPNDSIKVLPDSSNFVTASLIVISPGSEIYSVFGHCALRLECPSQDLDLCYTYETDASSLGYIQFITGKAKGSYSAIPTGEFFSHFKKEGRQLLQRELALSHHEKQNLWRNLDDEMVDVGYRKFNLLSTNCLSMSLFAIEKSLIGEYLDFGKALPLMEKNDGELTRYYCRNYPWAEFLYMTIVGNSASGHIDTEMRLAPEIIIPILEKASIKNSDNGIARKVFKSNTVEITPLINHAKPGIFSPQLIFTALLLVIVLITVCEWKWRCNKIAKVTDLLLIICQALVGVLLLYTTFVSNIFDTNWNWYLIPFNPLYLFLLYPMGKEKKRKLFSIATIVLLLFVAATPFIPQLDWTHQLITTSLIIRYLSRILKGKSA